MNGASSEFVRLGRTLVLGRHQGLILLNFPRPVGFDTERETDLGRDATLGAGWVKARTGLGVRT